MQREAGLKLADHLGRALQLTNILRDLDEDAAMGRLYLPREALRGVGIISTDPATVLTNPMLGEACVVISELAKGHFHQAKVIMARERRRVVRAPRISASHVADVVDSPVVCVIVWSAISWPCAAYSWSR